MKAQKVLIVYDGAYWFVRRVASSLHDGIHDEKVYHCDQPIGSRYRSLDAAAKVAKTALKNGFKPRRKVA